MFTVYGERFHKYEPIIDSKSKEVLDDGVPKRVQLSRWNDEKIAKHFSENVKNSVPKRSWKIWIEQS